MDDVRLLRLTEVAELLSISRTKVYELVASGQIPSLHVGRLRRVPLSALRDWISEQTERAAPVHSAQPPTRTGTRSRTAETKPAARARLTARPRAPKPTNTPTKMKEAWPFFKPWMPRPMNEHEYRAWVAHLNAHPDEKALVIEAMGRHDASR
jgi:excisionase family DNA binding protein